MIRPMVMEYMFIKMEPDTKENGKMICSMVKAKRYGLITLCTRVTTMRERNMEKDSIFGKTAPVTMATGSKIELKAKVFTNGKMVVPIQVPGKIITCTAKVYTPGLMAENTKDNMKWIKSTAMEFTNGPMAEFMKVTGIMVNSMAKENIFCKMEL